MAFELELTKDRTYELLELTVNNGARPVIIIEDPEGVTDEIVDLLFSDRKDTVVFDYNDFVMDQAFDVDKVNKLTDYCFVIIKNVKYLYGKSATARILSDFAKRMSEESTAVVFVGKRACYDMAEFAEQAYECLHYIIKIESEEEEETQ